MTVKFLLTCLLITLGYEPKDMLAEGLVIIIIVASYTKVLGGLVKTINTDGEILFIKVNETGVVYRKEALILHIP